MNKKIGILAGMGPRSTAPFIDMIIQECAFQYGAKFDMDFPAMLIYSLPTPFYPDRPIDHEKLSTAILAGLKELAGYNVDFIAMPCNIAHLYYNKMKDAVSVPLLNILDETVARIPQESRSVALFTARGTAESGLYQQGVIASGRTAVLKPEWQSALDALIMAVKKDGPNDANAQTMAELLADAGRCSDCVIIGCTDLTLMIAGIGMDSRVLDSARCLASATVARYVDLRSSES